MFGKASELELLAERKKFLLAESELNRIQLLQDWSRLQNQIHALTDSVKAVRSLASSATKMGALFLFLRRIIRRRKQASAIEPAEHSFVSSLVNGVKSGVALWQTLRSPRR